MIRKYLIICILLINLVGCQSDQLTDKDRLQFISEKKIEDASEIILDDRSYYFYETLDTIGIYVLKGKKNSGFISSHTQLTKSNSKVYFGGVDKGYIGLYISNSELINNTKIIRLVINSEIFEYDFNNKKYFVIQNKNITEYNYKIEFLDSEKSTLYDFSVVE